MIKSLKIKNCQSHKDTTLNFHKGLNVVIGDSDQGKSAVFNAMFKLMYNRPLGDEWRNWNGGVSKVEMEVDDNTIIYEKDKTASYFLNDTEFKAFGSEVPPEISDVLNIDRKINIQRQLEVGAPIFMISETPGDVAKFLNKVAGLYKIDETISNGKLDLQKTERKLNVVCDQIKDKKENLNEYSGIEKVADKIIKAEFIEKDIQQNTILRNEIIRNMDKALRIKINLKEHQERIKAKGKVDKAFLLYQDQNKINEEISSLGSKLTEIKRRKANLLKNTQKIQILPQINKALSLIPNMDRISSELTQLQQKIRRVRTIKSNIEYLNTHYKETALKYDEIKPEFCPICNTPMNK